MFPILYCSGKREKINPYSITVTSAKLRVGLFLKKILPRILDILSVHLVRLSS